MDKLDFYDSLYKQYLKEGYKTIKQILAQKYAIEKDIATKIKRNTKRLLKPSKNVFKIDVMDDDEFDKWSDIGIDNQRREKELSNF